MKEPSTISMPMLPELDNDKSKKPEKVIKSVDNNAVTKTPISMKAIIEKYNQEEEVKK